MPSETIKMVGLRRNPNEPLGLTVEVDEHDQLQVARILAGGMIDRQGLLHAGDVILEVNGVPVSTPEQLQDQISLAKESLTLKIGPSVDEEMKSARLTISGGQVKNGRNLDSGKKLTVSLIVYFMLFFIYFFKFWGILCFVLFADRLCLFGVHCFLWFGFQYFSKFNWVFLF